MQNAVPYTGAYCVWYGTYMGRVLQCEWGGMGWDGLGSVVYQKP
jgi:hypothetical protein